MLLHVLFTAAFIRRSNRLADVLSGSREESKSVVVIMKRLSACLTAYFTKMIPHFCISDARCQKCPTIIYRLKIPRYRYTAIFLTDAK